MFLISPFVVESGATFYFRELDASGQTVALDAGTYYGHMSGTVEIDGTSYTSIYEHIIDQINAAGAYNYTIEAVDYDIPVRRASEDGDPITVEGAALKIVGDGAEFRLSSTAPGWNVDRRLFGMRDGAYTSSGGVLTTGAVLLRVGDFASGRRWEAYPHDEPYVSAPDDPRFVGSRWHTDEVLDLRAYHLPGVMVWGGERTELRDLYTDEVGWARRDGEPVADYYGSIRYAHAMSSAGWPLLLGDSNEPVEMLNPRLPDVVPRNRARGDWYDMRAMLRTL